MDALIDYIMHEYDETDYSANALEVMLKRLNYTPALDSQDNPLPDKRILPLAAFLASIRPNDISKKTSFEDARHMIHAYDNGYRFGVIEDHEDNRDPFKAWLFESLEAIAMQIPLVTSFEHTGGDAKTAESLSRQMQDKAHHGAYPCIHDSFDGCIHIAGFSIGVSRLGLEKIKTEKAEDPEEEISGPLIYRISLLQALNGEETYPIPDDAGLVISHWPSRPERTDNGRIAFGRAHCFANRLAIADLAVAYQMIWPGRSYQLPNHVRPNQPDNQLKGAPWRCERQVIVSPPEPAQQLALLLGTPHSRLLQGSDLHICHSDDRLLHFTWLAPGETPAAKLAAMMRILPDIRAIWTVPDRVAFLLTISTATDALPMEMTMLSGGNGELREIRIPFHFKIKFEHDFEIYGGLPLADATWAPRGMTILEPATLRYIYPEDPMNADEKQAALARLRAFVKNRT